MDIPIPPGVFDILPKDSKETWRSSYIWDYVESIIRKTAKDYGYQEIRTPIFERTELFVRGVGETSDIVSKEMYTFLDKGDRSMSLRPEGTAPVIRSIVENQLLHGASTLKVFYIGPMFRYERTQAGRYRQHHQFGVEAIGTDSPEQDTEAIDLLYTLYQRLGLKNLRVSINSIGNTASRNAFRIALQAYLKQYYDRLSADSKNRFERNPLRILDSKDPQDIKINENAPSILEYLDEESKQHFESVKKLLTLLGIPFEVNPKLVRGLDYYNKTVFEITSGDLGAQNSVGGGGRYDGLIKTLGGPDLPAFGFGTGIERMIQTMIKQEVPLPQPPYPTLYIIPLGDEAKKVCFSLLHNLRTEGVSSEMDFSGRKLNKLMQYADQIRAQYVAVIGDEETKSQEIELKEMSSGKKFKIPIKDLVRIMKIESSSEDFTRIWIEMSRPFESDAESAFFIKKLENSIKETKHLSKSLETVVEKVQGLLNDI